MKQLLKEFLGYNLWANRQLTSSILALDSGEWTKSVSSSFPSLHKTLLHMWDADSIWWQRLEGEDNIKVPSKYFQEDTTELVGRLLLQNEAWTARVNDLDADALAKTFSYKNLKGEQFEQPLYQLVLHLCNHGTYHRGQLVTMLRTLGVKEIPQTDFVHWARKI